jgi:hypothetical protein
MFCEDGVFMPSMDEKALIYSKGYAKTPLLPVDGGGMEASLVPVREIIRLYLADKKSSL